VSDTSAPSTGSPRTARQFAGVAARAAVGLAVPSALYYLLRGAGQSVYLSLVVSTLLSALPNLYALVRRRPANRLSSYFTAMTLAGLVITLIPGDTRFLLAKESIMVAVTGLAFLATLRSHRPLVYRLSRPLVEGRLHWPGDWEALWESSSRFRRMWRVSSVIWGLGLLADAATRVVFAYTVRPDLVPALGLGLYLVSLVGLNVIVSAYYVVAGVYDPRSPLRQGDPRPASDHRPDQGVAPAAQPGRTAPE
jgi:hypothetical protein